MLAEPFGIRNIGGTIYVTYALQDAAKHDDVPGEGHGFVNAFDTTRPHPPRALRTQKGLRGKRRPPMSNQ